jgi:hypothetical protein
VQDDVDVIPVESRLSHVKPDVSSSYGLVKPFKRLQQFIFQVYAKRINKTITCNFCDFSAFDAFDM